MQLIRVVRVQVTDRSKGDGAILRVFDTGIKNEVAGTQLIGVTFPVFGTRPKSNLIR
jgi:hypothetical protein